MKKKKINWFAFLFSVFCCGLGLWSMFIGIYKQESFLNRYVSKGLLLSVFGLLGIWQNWTSKK